MKRIFAHLAIAASAALAWNGAMAVPTDARRAEAAKQAAGLVSQMTPSEMLGQLMMDSPAIPRLGVKSYHWWNEALHGVARAGLATVFPQGVGAAASFDAPLWEKVGDAVATEARAKYNLFQAKGDHRIFRGLTLWSPNVNMFRDPRWGRGQETMGEDPYLAGAMGGAYVRGLQGYDAKYYKSIACAKHFAVHSGPEVLRHGFMPKVSRRDLAEYYLPAFRTLVVDDRVETVMSAYNGLEGKPCSANRWLMTDLLRGEWGFKGHVVSDNGAIKDIYTGHHYAKSSAEASKMAIAAGVDLCTEYTYCSLAEEVKSGALASDTLKEPLVRLYTARALLGQFDPAGSTPWDKLGAESVASPEHRALALKMAEESLVLIANKNGALPLNRAKTHTIGVIGPRAQDEMALLGNYCGYSGRPVTCFSGLVQEAGPAVRVTDAPGGILGIDPTLNAIVACIGINANEEGEEGSSAGNAGGDRTSYGIAPAQLKSLAYWSRVAKSAKAKMITVVFGGSPFDLKPVVELSDAVIVAWYPGEQGGTAIARVIFGEANPSGRLPVTFPNGYADLPDFKDYSLPGRTYRYATKKPAFPFGYGLSYTTFAYANLKVARDAKGGATATVTVRNTGKVAGDEVVQLYVKAPPGAGDRRLHHLEGFTRVNLKPGEAKDVTLKLPELALQVYGEDGKPFTPKGAATVFVGGGQPGFADVAEAKLEL